MMSPDSLNGAMLENISKYSGKRFENITFETTNIWVITSSILSNEWVIIWVIIITYI